MGPRPARRECRPRHEADAGSRNPEEPFRQFCFGRTAFLLPAFPLNRGARLRIVCVIAPDSTEGMATLTKDKQALETMYRKGWQDAGKLIEWYKQA